MHHPLNKTPHRRFTQRLKQTLSFGLIFLICLGCILSCQRSLITHSLVQPEPSQSTEIDIDEPPRPIFERPPQVERDRLNTHLTTLSVERYTETQKQRTRSYIQTQLTQNGWETEEQPFPGGVNIIAHQRNSDRQNGEILVGAHYDSIRGTPGADDNATGVAALLELSRIFQTYSAPKALTLAFFDLEEDGAIGSSAFTNEPLNLAQLNGVIILEMLGYTCHTPNCQGVPPELKVQLPSDKGDFLSIIGDQEHLYLLDTFEKQTNAALSLFSLKVPFKGLLSPILLRSDHAPFWLKGIGAVMVSDTAFLRNPHYHRVSDTASTIDLYFFTQATDLVARATSDLLHQPSGSNQSA